MARTDFRSQAAKRLANERTDYTPALIDLLQPQDPTRITEVRRVSVDRIQSNPDQPRQHFDEDALHDLAASIREHGVLQPILVRPREDDTYQIIAGERRWRAARIAGLAEMPVIIEHIDDEAAMEIAIIENLQREDISPLEEAEMLQRMTTEHGYSLRKLATKLGKDKGYVENRLRIARAPEEIRELVAQRSDTLSAAYELMKVHDVRKRRRLARQVARGELSLVKLRQRIEGKPQPAPSVEAAASAEIVAGAGIPFDGMPVDDVPLVDTAEGHIGAGLEAAFGTELDIEAPLGYEADPEATLAGDEMAGPWPVDPVADAAELPLAAEAPLASEIDMDETAESTIDPRYVAVPVEPEGLAVDDVDIDGASDHLTRAIEELTTALLSDPALAQASHSERQQFAKYLTLAKIKLENAIAVVRSTEVEPSLSDEAQLTAAEDGPRG